MNNMHIGIVSGYFNPIHRGHLEYINAAKEDCDFLVVIVNNDLQVRIKGSKEFMDEEHRLEVINNLKSTDLGMISIDESPSVVESIKFIWDSVSSKFIALPAHTSISYTFYNSGDRHPDATNSKEDIICNQLGIKTKFLDLPKIYSSSELKNSVY